MNTKNVGKYMVLPENNSVRDMRNKYRWFYPLLENGYLVIGTPFEVLLGHSE